jgi:hypothetical protein
VRALGEETLKAPGRLRDRVGCCYADDIEAVLARGGGERGVERDRLAQKSRSA